jgi:hypothetical protein
MWLLCLGFVLIAPAPVLLSMVQELPSDTPAFMNSIYMAVNFVIGSLAMFIMGLLSDIFPMGKVYLFTPLAGIPAVIAVLLLRKRKQKS